MGVDRILKNKHEYKVFYESNPDNPPEEFKDIERDIDPDFDKPKFYKEKTHTEPIANIKKIQTYRSAWKKLKRYKKHKI